MKPGRQSVILEIIQHQNIETQRQLQEALLERGVKSTQATLSRDIKDMRLVKELGPTGAYRYTVSGRSEEDDARQRLQKIKGSLGLKTAAAESADITKETEE